MKSLQFSAFLILCFELQDFKFDAHQFPFQFRVEIDDNDFRSLDEIIYAL